MTQATFVSNVIRDMISEGLILEAEEERAKMIADSLWVAGWEYYRKYEAHHDGNVSPISYYGMNDERLATYPSIAEAERNLKIPRKTINNTLYGRGRRMRNGHYFRYANEDTL